MALGKRQLEKLRMDVLQLLDERDGWLAAIEAEFLHKSPMVRSVLLSDELEPDGTKRRSTPATRRREDQLKIWSSLWPIVEDLALDLDGLACDELPSSAVLAEVISEIDRKLTKPGLQPVTEYTNAELARVVFMKTPETVGAYRKELRDADAAETWISLLTAHIARRDRQGKRTDLE